MDLLPKSEVEERVLRFQKCLQETGTDAAFLFQNADVYYFSGTVQSGLLCIPANGEPLFLIQKSFSRGRDESPWEHLIEMPDPRKAPDLLAARGFSGLKRVGLEMDVLPTTHFVRLQKLFAGVQFVDVSDAIRKTRMIKSGFEIERIRTAARKLSRALAEAAVQIRPGVTELQLSDFVESLLRQQGHPGRTRMRAFNGELGYGTVSSGPSASYPTCFPGPVGSVGLSPALPVGAGWRAFVPGDTVLVDIAGGYGGYIADITRTFSLGEPPAEMRDAHDRIVELMAGVESMLHPGTACDEIYRFAVDWISRTPYAPGFMGCGDSRVRFLGHGVGLELDDLPVLAPGFDICLQAGMTIAIEPKIFFPDRGGVGIEDTYLITSSGFEKLTEGPGKIWIV